MPFAIIFQDPPGTQSLRDRLRPAHVDYIKANAERLLASGGLLSDDGATGHGGLIILDTEDRAEAESFVAADPFFTGGLYGQYTVSRWRKAVFNLQSFLP